MNAISPVAAAAARRAGPPGGPVAPPAGPCLAEGLLTFVARAMGDPAMCPDKLSALLREQRQIVADDAAVRFKRAMSACQAEIRPVVRDALNAQTRSRYATLEAIDAAISPVYARHGFSLEFDSEPGPGTDVVIVCEVSHEAGHSKFRRLTAPLDTAGPNGNANKTPLHGLGSTVSYLRRYLTCMVFNVTLTNEDTDGQRPRGAGDRISEAQATELRALMAATQTEEGRFLAAMCPDLRSLAQAPAADFARLKGALATKRAMLVKREQQALAERAAAVRNPRAQGAAA